MIIENNIIPFKGFKAINLFGIIFKRKDTKPMAKKDINHENIHTTQMKELLYIPFYIIYLLEYIYWLLLFKNFNLAYRCISFEREAYANEYNFKYLNSRKHYSQWNN